MPVDFDACPICGKAGMVGREREIAGDSAITVFKCHHCNSTWRIPDPPDEPDERPPSKPVGRHAE